MTTIETHPEQVAEALAGRLFEAGLGAIELACVHLGVRLGLYRPLVGRALTSDELAAEAGIDARYAQEWCEQQAAAGLLTVDDADAAAGARRYTLPAGAEAVLLDPDSPAYLVPMGDLVAGVGRVLPALTRAYREGTGVPYADYEFHDVQAAFNRPVFNGPLVREWLPSMTDLHRRFTAGAVVAELGCGAGYAAVALARAYPALRVHAFDADDASVAAARWLALHEGVADRVRFEVADVAEPLTAAEGRYDAVFAFEMVHDLARPVDALRTARQLVRGPDGSGDGPVIVMDERAAERFTAPAEPIERFLYAASVLHCLPVGRCEEKSAATGTVLRPATLRRYATEAGFASVTVLPIDHDMFRFYRLEG
jgi:2-polyprenyl-3-methyl-5-hydroxy-6-metoxy-1,4-benzoquinol methylase